MKNPPSTYQQPAVDLIGGLNAIAEQISGSGYATEYDFELAILRLVQSSHDGHLIFNGGASAAFGFTSPYQLLSISTDGIQLPKVYAFGP